MLRNYSQVFAVVGAIIEREGKILLVKETKEIAKNQWNQPAGWIELGENPIEAVEKEVREETGFDFEPTHILGIYSLYNTLPKEKFGIVLHPIKIIFIGKISEKQTGQLAEDASGTKWFLPEEIESMDKKALRDMDIKREIKDYFGGKRYPLELLSHTIQE